MTNKVIGKNINVTDTANSVVVSVGSGSAVTLLAAQLPADENYIEVIVTNNGNRALWVRRRPAAADNNLDGRRMPPGETVRLITDSDLYTGEISAIFESGPAKDVIVEWL